MIFMALLLAGQAYAPPPCTDFASGGEARCAIRDFQNADRAMLLEFDLTITRIRNCRPRNATGCFNRQRAILLVTREQQSWVAWRNAHCDLVAFGMEGTSGEGQVRMDCRARLTLARTKELKAMGRN
jgi:uncharacterized protein YecT (DUF1311 family)